MSETCPKCNFKIIKHDDPSLVLRMLRTRKKNGDDKKYPILVADFHCEKCKKTIHAKWMDLDTDLDVRKCSECNESLVATVFLGHMTGFTLETYCFSCYNKLNSGKIGFQK